MSPNVKDVDIHDIAHALAHICRFGGHCKEFYSVAQHSMIVALNCSLEATLQGLLHDATEAYIGDMIRPLKYSMPDYRAAEDRLWLVIADAFGVNPVFHPSIKVADNRTLITERRDLITQTGYEWSLEKDFPPYMYKIYPLTPDAAESEFLNMYRTFASQSLAQ